MTDQIAYMLNLAWESTKALEEATRRLEATIEHVDNLIIGAQQQ